MTDGYLFDDLHRDPLVKEREDRSRCVDAVYLFPGVTTERVAELTGDLTIGLVRDLLLTSDEVTERDGGWWPQ